jgi:hypothetical protein
MFIGFDWQVKKIKWQANSAIKEIWWQVKEIKWQVTQNPLYLWMEGRGSIDYGYDNGGRPLNS